jgi:threonyl-tRNA synthetase
MLSWCGLSSTRRDAAHVLAEAVQDLLSGTQVTGPIIENGFFYDCACAWNRDAAKALHRRSKLGERQPKRGNQALGRRDATRSIQSAMLAEELTIHAKPVREGTPMAA